MLRFAVAVAFGFSESLAITVKSKVPVTFGVPEIVPVFGFSDKPCGKEPPVMAQMYG
jgi:hypothetical protein